MTERILVIATKLVPPKYARKLMKRSRLLKKLQAGEYRRLSLFKAPSGLSRLPGRLELQQ